MSVYYNEHDPKAAAWLRELIADNLIANGDVDERSIEDVNPTDLAGYTQCHFFAGIGGWSYALRLSGWPDDQPAWTGSCPCQPFSAAGQSTGVADERHLWPAWFHLIFHCRPPVIFGEQVEAAIRHGWLDLVSADLEGSGYAVGAAVLPAASVGTPHIRSRLWFVADSLHGRASGYKSAQQHQGGPQLGSSRQTRLMADRESERCGEAGAGIGRFTERIGDSGEFDELEQSTSEQMGISRFAREPRTTDSELADCQCEGLEGRTEQSTREECEAVERSGRLGDFWHPAVWLPCRDGKWRPVESSIERLVDGVSQDLGLVRLESYPDHPHQERLIYSPLIKKGKARVMRLRGYGNAIVPQVAKAFIEAYLSVEW